MPDDRLATVASSHSALLRFRHIALLSRDKDPDVVHTGTAIAAVNEAGIGLAARQCFHLLQQIRQRVAVVRIAWVAASYDDEDFLAVTAILALTPNS